MIFVPIGMAVYMCVYLLLLLVTVTVFSHCGATEYYVRPTEPTIPPVLLVYIHLIDECICRTQPGRWNRDSLLYIHLMLQYKTIICWNTFSTLTIYLYMM